MIEHPKYDIKVFLEGASHSPESFDPLLFRDAANHIAALEDENARLRRELAEARNVRGQMLAALIQCQRHLSINSITSDLCNLYEQVRRAINAAMAEGGDGDG